MKHIRVETAEDLESIPEREWFFVPHGTHVTHTYEGFEMQDGKPVIPEFKKPERLGRLRRILGLGSRTRQASSSNK